MSKPSNLLHVKTRPKPFGVQVEWKWPDGSYYWGSSLELQYLFDDGLLKKDDISWPVTRRLIGGLNAGEHLQIRLRLTDKDGHAFNWSQEDWIDGVTYSDAGEYLAKIGGQVSQNPVSGA